MEQKTETIITYETLFEILRREKSRPELQKQDAGFFHQVVQYLREKKALMMANPSENLKNQHQYENIKKLLRDIYGRREKKIISLALDKSRTNASVIDTSSLLPEERKLYDETVSLFNKSRQRILLSLFELQHPVSETEPAKAAVAEKSPSGATTLSPSGATTLSPSGEKRSLQLKSQQR